MTPFVQRVLTTLFGLYVAELFLGATGFNTTWLYWMPMGAGFGPWQVITRFAVQGGDVLSVLISLLMIFFLLPPLENALSQRQLTGAFGAAAAGATALPLLLDLAGLGTGPVFGWAPLVTIGAVCLFGLAYPHAEILLFFVAPVRAPIFVWGSLLLSVLFLLSAFGGSTGTLQSSQYLGTWLGTWLWWTQLGPGAKTRTLRRKADNIRSQLRHFEVLQGGKQDDKTVH
jgi:hypothetical protein